MKFRDLHPELADLERYDGNLNISSINLTSLDGCPKKIVGNFWCDGNELTSLDGCPKEIDGDFWCDGNELTSLVGGPEKINGAYYCRDNKLTSLDGIASYIGSGLDFEYNQIESIKGIHKQIKFFGGTTIRISKFTTKGLLDLFLLNAPNLKYLRGNNEINGIFTKYFELIRQGEMSNLEAMLECQSELIEKNLDRYAE